MYFYHLHQVQTTNQFYSVLLREFLNHELAPLLNRITGIQLSHSQSSGESTGNSLANSNGKSNTDSSFVFDLFAARYSGGDFLLCHDDRLSNRRIAFVYNLTENWLPEEGGALEILETDGQYHKLNIHLYRVISISALPSNCYNSPRPTRSSCSFARSRLQFALLLRSLAHFLSPGSSISDGLTFTFSTRSQCLKYINEGK